MIASQHVHRRHSSAHQCVRPSAPEIGFFLGFLVIVIFFFESQKLARGARRGFFTPPHPPPILVGTGRSSRVREPSSGSDLDRRKKGARRAYQRRFCGRPGGSAIATCRVRRVERRNDERRGSPGGGVRRGSLGQGGGLVGERFAPGSTPHPPKEIRISRGLRSIPSPRRFSRGWRAAPIRRPTLTPSLPRSSLSGVDANAEDAIFGTPLIAARAAATTPWSRRSCAASRSTLIDGLSATPRSPRR